VPRSLQHNDLHAGNVLADGERFFDWGDAYVGHPFEVLYVTLGRAEQAYGPQALDRLRDAYLEPWAPYGTRAQLLREARLAAVTARVGLALSWRRALGEADDESSRQWGGGAAGTLGELAGLSIDACGF
jgi:aminoglycoside phosphotransferase (APT) family kinase protein